MSRLNPLVLIFCCFLFVNNLQEIEVTVGLDRLYEEHTGKKGTIVVTTDYNSAFDNFVDTTRLQFLKPVFLMREKTMMLTVDSIKQRKKIYMYSAILKRIFLQEIIFYLSMNRKLLSMKIIN